MYNNDSINHIQRLLKPNLLTYIDNLRDHFLQLIYILLILPNFLDFLSAYITGQNYVNIYVIQLHLLYNQIK